MKPRGENEKKMIAVLTILVFLPGLLAQQQQWSYTGSIRNKDLDSTSFEGKTVDLMQLFFSPKEVNESSVYFGGVLAKFVSRNDTLEEVTQLYICSLLNISNSSVKIDYVMNFDLFAVIDYAAPVPEEKIVSREVGLYNFFSQTFSKLFWMDSFMGRLVAVVFDSGQAVDGGAHDRHVKNFIVINSDPRGRKSLILHTWNEVANVGAVPGVSESPAGVEERVEERVEDRVEEIARPHASSLPLTVMTYNLWHNNPPSWVWRDYSERVEKYDARLRHFADVVVETDPDVLLLQEVRLDTTFILPTGAIGEPTGRPDAGSQINHLLRYLEQAHQRKNPNQNTTQRYHVAFQPAMSLLNLNQAGHRNEEGVAIISKHRVTKAVSHLLPRNFEDKSDDHQRAVLQARVMIHGLVEVDFMTSHLSLSSAAREKSVKYIKELSFNSSTVSLSKDAQVLEVDVLGNTVSPSSPSPTSSSNPCSSVIQILTGDLNAEPHEASIADLTASERDSERGIEFVDTWRLLNPIDDASGFTFPACEPVKRIDFVFIDRSSLSASESGLHHCAAGRDWHAEVASVSITGRDPTESTAALVNSREGLGMLDVDSPTWASDHFAVVTKFLLHQQINKN